MLYPYCAQDTIMEMYSRDITLLIDFCDLISWTITACFSTFYRCAIVPTLVENSKFFCVLVIVGSRPEYNPYSFFRHCTVVVVYPIHTTVLTTHVEIYSLLWSWLYSVYRNQLSTSIATGVPCFIALYFCILK